MRDVLTIAMLSAAQNDSLWNERFLNALDNLDCEMIVWSAALPRPHETIDAPFPVDGPSAWPMPSIITRKFSGVRRG
jgi:hypothetical protein